MRDANQGFFDVAINFEDVFCSAKLDCTYDNDGNVPINLLFDPVTGERRQTAVVALACTQGPNADNRTHLHVTDVRYRCGSAMVDNVDAFVCYDDDAYDSNPENGDPHGEVYGLAAFLGSSYADAEGELWTNPTAGTSYARSAMAPPSGWDAVGLRSALRIHAGSGTRYAFADLIKIGTGPTPIADWQTGLYSWTGGTWSFLEELQGMASGGGGHQIGKALLADPVGGHILGLASVDMDSPGDYEIWRHVAGEQLFTAASFAGSPSVALPVVEFQDPANCRVGIIYDGLITEECDENQSGVDVTQPHILTVLPTTETDHAVRIDNDDEDPVDGADSGERLPAPSMPPGYATFSRYDLRNPSFYGNARTMMHGMWILPLGEETVVAANLRYVHDEGGGMTTSHLAPVVYHRVAGSWVTTVVSVSSSGAVDRASFHSVGGNSGEVGVAVGRTKAAGETEEKLAVFENDDQDYTWHSWDDLQVCDVDGAGNPDSGNCSLLEANAMGRTVLPGRIVVGQTPPVSGDVFVYAGYVPTHAQDPDHNDQLYFLRLPVETGATSVLIDGMAQSGSGPSTAFYARGSYRMGTSSPAGTQNRMVLWQLAKNASAENLNATLLERRPGCASILHAAIRA